MLVTKDLDKKVLDHIYPWGETLASIECNIRNSYRGIIPDEKLSQVCSTDERRLKSVIVDDSYTDAIKSENIHKSINTNKLKYTIYETEDLEPSVTYNPIINEPSFLTYSSAVKIS